MTKINFQNLPNTTTPVNATNLNAMQTNVETEINAINDFDTYSLTNTPAHSIGTNSYSVEKKGKAIYFICNTIWFNSITANTWLTIGVLPTAIRPANSISTSASFVDGNGNIIGYGRMDMQTNGDARVKSNVSATNLTGVCFSISWLIS